MPRVAQAVALPVFPYRDAVQNHVDARDVVSCDVGFLAVQLQLTHIAAVFFNVTNALQQQTAGAAGPVSNGHAGFWLQHFGHQEADFGGRIKLAAGFTCPDGEIADQVLVSVAEKIVGDVGTVESLAAEMVD